MKHLTSAVLMLISLTLSVTFTKLLCLALKYCICRLVDSRLHASQRCVPGRNILENVLLVDAAMHKYS